MDKIEGYIVVEDEMSYEVRSISEVSVLYLAEIDIDGQRITGGGRSCETARLDLLRTISSAEKAGQLATEALSFAVAAALSCEPTTEVYEPTDEIGGWTKIGWLATPPA